MVTRGGTSLGRRFGNAINEVPIPLGRVEQVILWQGLSIRFCLSIWNCQKFPHLGVTLSCRKSRASTLGFLRRDMVALQIYLEHCNVPLTVVIVSTTGICSRWTSITADWKMFRVLGSQWQCRVRTLHTETLAGIPSGATLLSTDLCCMSIIWSILHRH